MNKRLMATLFMSLSFTALANAAESTALYVIKSVNINAPASAAWDKISKFGDLGAWHPAFAKTVIVSGKDYKAGAKRELTLQDGGKINETLTAYSAKNKTMTYKITESVLPLNDYVSSLHVYSNGANHSVVVWESSFKAKAPADDKAASDLINGVYDAGLNNLKKMLE